MENKPVSIKKRENSLEVAWADGFSASMPLERFREHCPCAECRKDELNKGAKFGFGSLKQFKEGMNELKQLKQVGNYAAQPVWGDGHDAGIYRWDYIRKIFEDENKSADSLK